MSLTVIKDVRIPGLLISSVTKLAMSCPVGLMLATVGKVYLSHKKIFRIRGSKSMISRGRFVLLLLKAIILYESLAHACIHISCR